MNPINSISLPVSRPRSSCHFKSALPLIVDCCHPLSRLSKHSENTRLASIIDILCDCRTSRGHNSNKEAPSLQERQIFIRILPFYGLQLRTGESGRDLVQSVFGESRAIDEGLQIDDNIETKIIVECCDIGL